MKKLFSCMIIIAAFASFSLTGWAQEKESIRYVTGKMGSATYNLGVAIAHVIEKNTNLKVFVEPAAGSSAQAILLSKYEADIGIIPAGHAYTLRYTPACNRSYTSVWSFNAKGLLGRINF